MTRLFIMDDEVLIRQGIRHSIRWQDYGITVCGEATNAREALRSLPKSTPDIIIADIQMPQMDGFAFLEKAIEILPHLRVIILTGYSNPEYMIRAIRCGAFDLSGKARRFLGNSCGCTQGAVWPLAGTGRDPPSRVRGAIAQ